jgi:hypothetical protein
MEDVQVRQRPFNQEDSRRSSCGDSLRIDFRIAGLGDAWMRLMALATLSRIRPGERHVVYPPKILVPLAQRLFGDSFDVEAGGPADIEMSHLGLRHLLPGMLAGKRYYSPFYWILRETRSKPSIKDKINDLGFLAAIATTRLSRPRREYVYEYQGFMEMQGLRPFRNVTPEEYRKEAQNDFDAIHLRVLEMFGEKAAGNRNVVFPSGSAHQIMPPEVAARVLHDAEFAFHEKDDFAKDYEREGLKVIRFGNPPEEVCELIASAAAVFCVDSFPSHLAQMWKDRAVVMLTEMKAGMTVHPGFPSQRVVASRAECHPCRHLARIDADHRCAAGRVFCATWESAAYMEELARAAWGLTSK